MDNMHGRRAVPDDEQGRDDAENVDEASQQDSEVVPARKPSFWQWLRRERPLVVRADLDALFGQFLNTVITLVLICSTCKVRCTRAAASAVPRAVRRRVLTSWRFELWRVRFVCSHGVPSHCR
jgi:hypothetical protein